MITDNGTNFTSKEFKKILWKHGHQIEVGIRSASKDKQTSRKSKRANMQWHKEEAIGAPRKSQTRLGRWVTLRALESF
jgi:hypothetical protein